MSIWGSIMTAYERFVFQRLVSIVRSVLNPVVMILLLVVGYKAVAMVVVTTLFNIITLIINFIIADISCMSRYVLGISILLFLKKFRSIVSGYSLMR